MLSVSHVYPLDTWLSNDLHKIPRASSWGTPFFLPEGFLRPPESEEVRNQWLLDNLWINAQLPRWNNSDACSLFLSEVPAGVTTLLPDPNNNLYNSTFVPSFLHLVSPLTYNVFTKWPSKYTTYKWILLSELAFGEPKWRNFAYLKHVSLPSVFPILINDNIPTAPKPETRGLFLFSFFHIGKPIFQLVTNSYESNPKIFSISPSFTLNCQQNFEKF